MVCARRGFDPTAPRHASARLEGGTDLETEALSAADEMIGL